MAQRIPKEVIDEIQQRVSIVDVIGKYVPLKKQGANYFGLCPFQAEKTPSFSVNEQKKIFHCFSCGRGGSVFTFIMAIDNLSFVEAVSKVAEIGGIPFDSFRYQNHATVKTVDFAVKKVLDFSRDFYHHILEHTAVGQNALNYLQQRKILPETIATFNLGYAPDNNLLAESFKAAPDLSAAAIKESNLINNVANNNYDYFKDRLMIPINDESGELVGFGGRALPLANSKEPKYLNSKQSKIFNKGNLLFNLDRAKSEIAISHEAVLLEGYFDVISAWQAGLKNTVASMGTSFTTAQLKLLNKTTNRLVLAYDGDAPGKAAIDKAIDSLSQQKNLEILVAPIPGGLDPDDYIKKYGAASFQKLVNKERVSQYRFRLDYYQENVNFQNEQELLTFVERVLNKFSDLKDDPIQQEVYLRELAQITGISWLNLQNQFNQQISHQNQTKPRLVKREFTPVKKQADNRFERAQRELLFLAFNNDLFAWLDENYQWTFPNPDYQVIFELFKQYYQKNQGKVHFYAFLNELPPDLAGLATTINELDRPATTDQNEVAELINVIKKEDLEQKIKQTQQQIKQFQKLGQKTQLDASVKKLIELIRIKQQEVS